MKILRFSIDEKQSSHWRSKSRITYPGYLKESDPWKVFNRLDGPHLSSGATISDLKRELNTFVIVNNFRYEQDFI
jgi:hypothetical protein